MAARKSTSTGARKAAPPASTAKRARPSAAGARSGQNKTQETDVSVADFVAAVPSARRRQEAEIVLGLMRRVTRLPPRMWGPSIIGFGRYHYVYDSGREGDMPRMGFSPRKAALTLYLSRFARYEALLRRLGKHTTSVACLYIKRLEDVDLAVLEEMMRESWAHMAERYPE